ncbi:MAG TPA: hypothetical protein PKD24_15780 [Pyrinomonadaceae bacterium]|nr:hypothetical protein [Pyrinomonadaceae bacterium]HMP66866.1 hypothetical protein [Pyrinomonadaceae bacterium]
MRIVSPGYDQWAHGITSEGAFMTIFAVRLYLEILLTISTIAGVTHVAGNAGSPG